MCEMLDKTLVVNTNLKTTSAATFSKTKYVSTVSKEVFKLRGDDVKTFCYPK